MATEDMMRKNEEFDEVLRTNKDGKVDVKMLQMLIQGAIGTTVNQVLNFTGCHWYHFKNHLLINSYILHDV